MAISIQKPNEIRQSKDQPIPQEITGPITMPLCQWTDLASPSLTDELVKNAIAILPLGAMEQHGPHLPMATDAIIAGALALKAAEKAVEAAPDRPLLLLPVEMVGHSPEHENFPGTLSAPADALLARWQGIGGAVARAGIGKILMINAHGGQPQIMELAARALRQQHGMTAVTVSWPDLGVPEGVFPTPEIRYGLHGGQLETALMLTLVPHLVAMHQADDFSNQETDFATPSVNSLGPAQFSWMAEDLNAQGVTGNASAATADQGIQLLDYLTDKLARIINDLGRLPNIAERNI